MDNLGPWLTDQTKDETLRITAQEEYGLRCMVHLARTADGNPVTIQQMAQAEKLSPAYVGKLLQILRKGGLVQSLQGPAGGYRLPRSADQTSVAEILEVLGGRLFKVRHCERYPGGRPRCVHSGACAIRSLWSGLDLIVERVLARTRLRDLAAADRPLSEWIRAQVPAILEAASAVNDRDGG